VEEQAAWSEDDEGVAIYGLLSAVVALVAMLGAGCAVGLTTTSSFGSVSVFVGLLNAGIGLGAALIGWVGIKDARRYGESAVAAFVGFAGGLGALALVSLQLLLWVFLVGPTIGGTDVERLDGIALCRARVAETQAADSVSSRLAGQRQVRDCTALLRPSECRQAFEAVAYYPSSLVALDEVVMACAVVYCPDLEPSICEDTLSPEARQALWAGAFAVDGVAGADDVALALHEALQAAAYQPRTGVTSPTTTP
jgi:hypothetical protein